ncbi:MAG: aspartate/glutamate racemase family protein [Burkholderiales bacterium]
MDAAQGRHPARIAVLGSGTRGSVLPPHLAARADHAAIPVLYTTRLAAFAGNPYDRLAVDLAYVDMAQRAEADGCAALFINTYADYGIEAMRAVVSIPVIGAGENAMTIAAEDGRRFSIVTVWPPSMKFLYDERTRNVAAGAACLKVRHVSDEAELQRLSAEDGVQGRMARAEDAIIDRIVRECEHAITEDGAQAIVLGCTCMAPVGPRIAARVNVPVVEGARAGYQAAVSAALHRPAVPSGPRTVRASLIPSIIDAYVGANPGAVQAKAKEACPVCVS